MPEGKSRVGQLDDLLKELYFESLGVDLGTVFNHMSMSIRSLTQK